MENGITGEAVKAEGNYAVWSGQSYAFSILQLRSDEPGRRWKLDVQNVPTPRITLSGVEPTLEEMTRALRYTGLPIWMIEVCMVLASTAVRIPD